MKEQYLLGIQLKRDMIPSFEEYPFSLPMVSSLDRLELHPKVTFFIGENGAGKSTLLEAIAVASGFNAEGGSKNFDFETNSTHSQLYEYIRLIKGIRRPKDGYFLRAESYYNLASNIDKLGVNEYYGGKSLHEQSHGEAFFALFQNRLYGEGLYIFDEPEAALSPMRLFSFLVRLDELVDKNSQFIIATHSPVILSYPNALIYLVDERGINKVEYENTDHYLVTKQFYSDYKHFLWELLKK